MPFRPLNPPSIQWMFVLCLLISAPVLASLDADLLKGLSVRTLGPAAVSGISGAAARGRATAGECRERR